MPRIDRHICRACRLRKQSAGNHVVSSPRSVVLKLAALHVEEAALFDKLPAIDGNPEGKVRIEGDGDAASVAGKRRIRFLDHALRIDLLRLAASVERIGVVVALRDAQIRSSEHNRESRMRAGKYPGKAGPAWNISVKDERAREKGRQPLVHVITSNPVAVIPAGTGRSIGDKLETGGAGRNRRCRLGQSHRRLSRRTAAYDAAKQTEQEHGAKNRQSGRRKNAFRRAPLHASLRRCTGKRRDSIDPMTSQTSATKKQAHSVSPDSTNCMTGVMRRCGSTAPRRRSLLLIRLCILIRCRAFRRLDARILHDRYRFGRPLVLRYQVIV